MKTKRPYNQVMPVALEVVRLLSKYTTSIEIAGSLRRKLFEVGDIEIVAIPAMSKNLLGEYVLGSSIITTNVLVGEGFEVYSGGDKYKKLLYKGHQVDLFLQTPETWGVNMMIRTGSKNFARRMVTRGGDGFCPLDYVVKGARVHLSLNVDLRNDESQPLATPEEKTIFDLWGMDWVEPEDRI